MQKINFLDGNNCLFSIEPIFPQKMALPKTVSPFVTDIQL